MSINQDILTALSDLEIPVAFQTYNGKEESYITFFTYLDKAEQHADDKDKITGLYLQLDVWSNSDYTDLVNTVHALMQEAGFIKLNYYDLYENDLKIYHKVMRYRIEEEL